MYVYILHLRLLKITCQVRLTSDSSTKTADSSTNASTTKVRQLKTAVSSTKVRQPKSWIRQPRGSSTKKVGFVNQKRRIHQPRFVNQIRQPKTRIRQPRIRQPKGWIRQPKTADSSTKVRQPKTRIRQPRIRQPKGWIRPKNGGFEGSGTFLACLEVEKLSSTCRCCVSCS